MLVPPPTAETGPTVPIRRAPPGEVRSSPDQREDSVGERGHSTDSRQSLTDTSPSPCPTGHTRIGEGDLLPHDLQRGWAGFVGSPWEGGLIVGDDLVGSIVRGFGGGPDRSGANASGEPELGFMPSASSACRVCSASTIGSRFPCEVSEVRSSRKPSASSDRIR